MKRFCGALLVEAPLERMGSGCVRCLASAPFPPSEQKTARSWRPGGGSGGGGSPHSPSPRWGGLAGSVGLSLAPALGVSRVVWSSGLGRRKGPRRGQPRLPRGSGSAAELCRLRGRRVPAPPVPWLPMNGLTCCAPLPCFTPLQSHSERRGLAAALTYFPLSFNLCR